MLITNHVLSGATVGALSNNSKTAFMGGVISHFVLDSIPHWGGVDYDVYLKTAKIDGTVGLATLSACALLANKEDRGRVLAGMLGACLPDIDKPNTYFFGRSGVPKWIQRPHQIIQKESPKRMRQEILVSVTLAGVYVSALYILKKKKRYTNAALAIN